MKRKVVLSKRASLWEAGDAARSIGVLESGRLGVMTDRGLVGVMLPGMIVGESAVFTLAGEKHNRTASVFALDDETTVAEYSIFLVKQALDDGRYDFAQEILLGLIVQACRNFELSISANEHRPLVTLSIRSLVKTLTESYEKQLQGVNSWDEFLLLFRYLSHLRDFSQDIRADLVEFTDPEEIERTSEMVQATLKPVAPPPIGEIGLKGEEGHGEGILERFDTPQSSSRADAQKKIAKLDQEYHRYME
ncbi:MAG TPA: cyclic nucleotide-binding domain-containing protein [Thermoanaerobaculia bacterium]|nr:cyclic nucleotide-binding domain-containing protein [Thermoanaerobaculia bacterium]